MEMLWGRIGIREVGRDFAELKATAIREKAGDKVTLTCDCRFRQ